MLTCSAPRHNQKQPTERHQHPKSTFPQHAKHSPRFCYVCNIYGAINALQQRLALTLCGAYLTVKRTSLPVTQCAKCPEESWNIFPMSSKARRWKKSLIKFLRNSEGISLTEVDCAPPLQQNVDHWLHIWHYKEMLVISIRQLFVLIHFAQWKCLSVRVRVLA